MRVGFYKSTALIDSGATHCFISKAFTELCELKLIRSAQPLIVTLANGLKVTASYVADVAIEFPGP